VSTIFRDFSVVGRVVNCSKGICPYIFLDFPFRRKRNPKRGKKIKISALYDINPSIRFGK
jgi:hypothetical protein